MGTKILIVDNDKSFVKGLKYSLKQDGYIIETIDFGKDLVEKISKEDYDLILLDLMLPDINGLKLCQFIRNSSQIPIIIITKKMKSLIKF